MRYIAHELRTPLNSASLGLKLINTTLSSIENKDALDDEVMELASDVTKTVNTACQILEDLMTFSKIEAGMMTLHKLHVEVEEFINENVSIFQVSASL